MPAWLVLILSAAVVIAAGTRLARDGDTIAERTGLGGVWIGAILVAAATSLPELSTNTFAVLQGTYSLALGNVFGANMANVVLLALADLSVRKERLLMRISQNQALLGAIAISLMAVASIGLLLPLEWSAWYLGWPTLVIGAGYAAGMRLLQVSRPGPPFETPTEASISARQAPGLRPAVIGFTIAALAILLAARYLADSAEQVADQLGISTGFVGIALLALITTLPEATVSLASVRAGSYDLAVGNLLGSSCFNIASLLVLDLAHGPGSLLAQVDPGLLVGSLTAILLLGMALIEILNRTDYRILGTEPGPLLMVIVYFAGLYLVFQAAP